VGPYGGEEKTLIRCSKPVWGRKAISARDSKNLTEGSKTGKGGKSPRVVEIYSKSVGTCTGVGGRKRDQQQQEGGKGGANSKPNTGDAPKGEL